MKEAELKHIKSLIYKIVIFKYVAINTITKYSKQLSINQENKQRR